MLIFLHLPKTAGTTLRVMLTQVYGARRILNAYDIPNLKDVARTYDAMSTERQKEIAVISSHLDFGLHSLINVPARYFTLFRHPVDRIVSVYYFMRGGNGVEAHPIFRERPKLTLREYAESGVDNGYVRMISGQNGPSPVTPEHLEMAKQNLCDCFDAIGFAETYNESMVLFGRKLGWERVPLYRKENVMVGRPTVESIDTETIDIIKKNSAYDIELYEFAKQLYDRDIDKLGPDFAAEVVSYEGMLDDVKKLVLAEREKWKKEERFPNKLFKRRRPGA